MSDSTKGDARSNYALIVVGMACYWPMFRNNYLGLVFSESSGLIDNGGYFYLAMIVLLMALSVMAGVCPTKAAGILGHRLVIPVIASLTSLLIFLLIIIPAGSSFHMLISIVCVVVFALYFFFITLAWGTYLSSVDHTRIMLYLALSFLISYLLSYSTKLPGMLAFILPLSGPLLSGIAWYLQPAANGSSRPFSKSLLRQPMIRTALILVLFLLIGSVIRGFFELGVLNYASNSGASPRALLSMLFSLMLVVVVYLSGQFERWINIFCMAFLLLFFTGMFITAALNTEWWEQGTDIVVMSRTFIGFFFWIVLLNIASRFQQSPVLLFGVLFISIDCISALLTNYVSPLLSINLSGMPGELASAFVLAMALILLLGSFAYLSSLAFKRAAVPDTMSEVDENARLHTCSLIADEHKLTSREREMLYYMSLGHSTKRIAEMLIISVSTAQTHAKSLYRKLGLHNRQQVIDLVSERLSLENVI